jgi:hypothetical protein
MIIHAPGIVSPGSSDPASYPKAVITAAEFFSAWQSVTTPQSVRLIELWNDRKPYTQMVLNDGSCILREVGAKVGLQCYSRNYYHVDGMLYLEEDFVPGRREGSYWLRGIRVAFEHEHKFNKRLYEEISHLLLIQADLRVVVSYPPGDGEDLLPYFHSIIAGSSSAEILHDQAGFLMILGHRDPFAWRGLVFTRERWLEI